MEIGCRRLVDDCGNVMSTKFRCKDFSRFTVYKSFKCDFKVSTASNGPCAFRSDDATYGFLCENPEAHDELVLQEKLESI